MNNCRSYGPDKFGQTQACRRMHARTQTHTCICHCDNYVSLISRGLSKNHSSKEPKCVCETQCRPKRTVF